MYTRLVSGIVSTTLVLFTTWLSRSPVICEVRCPGREIDSYVLGILEAQLARCGPEQLSSQPVSCTGLSTNSLIAGGTVIFVFGGLSGALCVLVRPRAPSPTRRPEVQREEVRALPTTPSSLRARSPVV